MKTVFTFLFCMIISLVDGQELERKATTQIKDVVVFLSGAQVTRSANLDIPQGVVTWTFGGLSPSINEQSVQVEVDPQIKILSVSYRINHLDPIRKSDAIINLTKERKRLLDLIDDEKGRQEVLAEEETMLKSNKEIGGQQQGVNINDLKIAVDYFRVRLTEIKQKQREASKQISLYKEGLNQIDAQLVELRNRKVQPTGEVIVKTSSKRSLKIPVQISYLVQEAKWYPSYDIRAIDIKSPLGITYKANVSQQSGEDWENVKLTISSANPSISGARPILNAWYLGFNNSIASRSYNGYGGIVNKNEIRGRVVSSEDGSPLPGVNIVIKGTTVGTVTDVNGEYSIPLTSDAQTLVFSFVGLQTQEISVSNRDVIDVNLQNDVTQLSEVVVTGYGSASSYESSSNYNYQPKIKKTIVATPVVRQTNIEFEIDEPYSIKSDGEIRSVEMIEYEMNASYQYYCVPKLDLDAFLVARLVDWDEYNLLEGEASLFFEGKYVGKTILDTRQTNDTLSLSLGRDKNVLVTREKLKDYSSNQILGSNKKTLFAYEILVRNKKAQEIDIRIEDQIPVPNTKEISVDKLEDSKGEVNNDTGLITWNKKVQPGKNEKIELRYAVKYPKYSRVILE